MKILIADDEPMMRELLAARLRVDGYDVVEAADGHETLLRVERESPDLIVLDRIMPGIDGFGVMRALRENTQTRAIPVVMLTGLVADEQDAVESIELGVNEYLTKPFMLAELSAGVRRLLAQPVPQPEAGQRCPGASATAVPGREEPDHQTHPPPPDDSRPSDPGSDFDSGRAAGSG